MPDEPTYATGGCQCGRVRFRVTEGLGRANLCHCRMCQRATGNAFAPLVTARGVVFEGEPARFASSNVAERGYCRDCGTPLFYAPLGSDAVELMIGALDDPEAARPALHYGIESRLGWLHLADGLPEYETRPGGLSGTGPGTITSRQHPVPGEAAEEDR
ncbi:GFA family protein [Limibaculum sp. M0105]|uniref:GFA family protein n=1 Tax=Thermohalobaculum xanthum TaxID=2753746 RepID=A0A8J7M7Y4_9RHOB|nr:GFA family protein [Thermohalobaculum xanthum]MBK0399966.1 GFA family protein [Thermohalobaculum xanthum]